MRLELRRRQFAGRRRPALARICELSAEGAAGTKSGRGWISDDSSGSRGSTVEGSGFETDILDFFATVAGRRIDILKIDIEGGEYALLEDPRFEQLDVRAVILEWHGEHEGQSGADWCRARLGECGFQLFRVFEQPSCGMMWGNRFSPSATGDALRLAEPAELELAAAE